MNTSRFDLGIDLNDSSCVAEVITSHKDIFDVEGRKIKAEEWKEKHAEALEEMKRLEKKHAETKISFQRKSEFTFSRMDKVGEREGNLCILTQPTFRLLRRRKNIARSFMSRLFQLLS